MTCYVEYASAYQFLFHSIPFCFRHDKVAGLQMWEVLGAFLYCPSHIRWYECIILRYIDCNKAETQQNSLVKCLVVIKFWHCYPWFMPIFWKFYFESLFTLKCFLLLKGWRYWNSDRAVQWPRCDWRCQQSITAKVGHRTTEKRIKSWGKVFWKSTIIFMKWHKLDHFFKRFWLTILFTRDQNIEANITFSWSLQKFIPELYLMKTFKTADKRYMHLKSDLKIPALRTVVKIGIQTEKGRELTNEEFLGVLEFVQCADPLEEVWWVILLFLFWTYQSAKLL